MTHASLFSGIGGFDLAAEWMGWTNVFNCEWEEFPQRVLKHHFPNAKQYGDIKELDATAYAGRIDILTGGFPCQPYSVAGKRMGKDDERHLWPEMLRVIREVQPRWVVGENVRGLINWNDGLVFEEVQSDLEAEGYDVTPYVLPACGVGAPHRRDRVWFIAYRNESDAGKNRGRMSGKAEQVWGQEEGIIPGSSCNDAIAPDTKRVRLEHGTEQGSVGQGKGEIRGRSSKATQANGGIQSTPNTMRSRGIQKHGSGKSRQSYQKDAANDWERFPTFPPICGGDDGLPHVLDGITFPKWRRESIKAYGNAIVPQVALQIFKAIQEYERLDR